MEQVVRQSVGKLHRLSRCGVVEADVPGVEELACEPEVLAEVAATVERVAHERVPHVAHVDADLMGASRVEVTLDEGVAVVARARLEALQNTEGRDGLACAGRVRDRHPHAVTRGAGDARLDGPLVVRDRPVHERDVAAVEHAQADEVLQGLLRGVVLGGDHEARGLHVQTVHDSGALLPLKHAEVSVAAVRDERVGERVVHVAGARVTDKARLLGEDDQMVILKSDVERDVGVGCERAAHGLRLVHERADAVPQQDLLGLAGGGGLVDGHRPVLHEACAGRARGHVLARSEKRIEPHAIGLGSYQQVHDATWHEWLPPSSTRAGRHRITPPRAGPTERFGFTVPAKVASYVDATCGFMKWLTARERRVNPNRFAVWVHGLGEMRQSQNATCGFSRNEGRAA